jgi:hypothetical protein
MIMEKGVYVYTATVVYVIIDGHVDIIDISFLFFIMKIKASTKRGDI